MPSTSESTIGRKFGTVFTGGLVSKGLGLAREVTLAYAFGTTYVADAFRVALTALLLPTHFLTGEALFAAFVPAYRRAGEGDRASLVRTAFTTLIGSTAVLVVVVVVAAPWVVSLMAPGFGPRAADLCATLIRVGSVGAVLYSLSALLVNIQIANGEYVLLAARPSVQNLGILASIVAAASLHAPALLTLGFVASYVVMTAWAFHWARRSRFSLADSLRPTRKLRKHMTGEFGRSVAQLSLFVMFVQGSAIVDRIVASLTGEGGVAAIDYSFFVTDSLRLLLAVPVATLAVGQLSGKQWDEISSTLRRAFAPLLVASVAISAYMFGLAGEIVTLLYRRGEFQEAATRLTTAALRGFALGAWAGTAGYVLQRVFNAAARNREVVRAGAASLAVNVILDIILYGPMGVLGIALATSASLIVLFGLLLAGSGHGRQLISRAWPAVFGLALWSLTLAAPLGDGILRLVLSGVTLTVSFGLCFVISRPLRDDLLWLVRRAGAR